jgi:pimeloyl-ACP methyl ester carboxylesterase
MWAPHVEPRGADYFVVAPDLRGHGLSSAPEGLDAYSIEIYAEDIRALLDHLGGDVCAIVGCSFGGMVALQFATTWPERLAGLVVSDAGAAYDNERYAEPYRERERRMLEAEDVVRRQGMAGLAKRAVAGVKDTFMAEGIRRRYLAMKAEGYLGASKTRRERPDLLPVVGERLTMPVLICIGEDDPVHSAADVMAEELPAARYVTFKGSGHGVPSARPEAFTEAVLRFFADIEEGHTIAGRRTV